MTLENNLELGREEEMSKNNNDVPIPFLEIGQYLKGPSPSVDKKMKTRKGEKTCPMSHSL